MKTVTPAQPIGEAQPSTPTQAPPPKSRFRELNVRFEGNEPKRDASKRVKEANKRLADRRKKSSKYTDEKPQWRGTVFGRIMDQLSKPMI